MTKMNKFLNKYLVIISLCLYGSLSYGSEKLNERINCDPADLACDDYLDIYLNEDGIAILTPEMVVENICSDGIYVVTPSVFTELGFEAYTVKELTTGTECQEVLRVRPSNSGPCGTGAPIVCNDNINTTLPRCGQLILLPNHLLEYPCPEDIYEIDPPVITEAGEYDITISRDGQYCVTTFNVYPLYPVYCRNNIVVNLEENGQLTLLPEMLILGCEEHDYEIIPSTVSAVGAYNYTVIDITAGEECTGVVIVEEPLGCEDKPLVCRDSVVIFLDSFECTTNLLSELLLDTVCEGVSNADYLINPATAGVGTCEYTITYLPNGNECSGIITVVDSIGDCSIEILDCEQEPLICFDTINVLTTDNSCFAILSPSMVLENFCGNTSEAYFLIEPLVFGLGLHEYTITYLPTGSQCTGIINVEDRLPPYVACGFSVEMPGDRKIYATDVAYNNVNDACSGVADLQIRLLGSDIWADYVDIDTSLIDTIQVVYVGVWDSIGNFDQCLSTVVIGASIYGEVISICDEGSLVCHDTTITIFAAVDECTVILSPEMLLDTICEGAFEGDFQFSPYSVNVGESVTYSITYLPTGENCSGVLRVEGHSEPSLACPDEIILPPSNRIYASSIADLQYDDDCSTIVSTQIRHSVNDPWANYLDIDTSIGTNQEVIIGVWNSVGNFSGCSSIVLFEETQLSCEEEPLVCYDNVNVSLGAECIATLTHDMLLDSICEGALEDDFSIVPNTEGLGVHDYTITHLSSGNQCSGTVTVADTQNPVAACVDTITIPDDGRIYPMDIDSGTNDNCGIQLLQIRIGTSPWGDFIDIDTSVGINEVVRLGVWDDSNNFSECLIEPITEEINSDVWSGDANNDGVADHYDLLNIGLGFGQTGPVRENASIVWIGQPAVDWASFSPLFNTNDKHADTDGSGIINSFDIGAILANWGNTHNFIGDEEEDRITDVPIFIGEPEGTLEIGPSYSLPIFLGTAEEQTDGVYGIAFSIYYDNEIFGDININFAESWLSEEVIDIQKDFSGSGRIDAAVSKIDGTNQSGHGIIGYIEFVMEDDLLLREGDEDINTTIFIGNVQLINVGGETIPTDTDSVDIVIEIDESVGTKEIEYNTGFSLYPNPVTNELNILTEKAIIKQVQVYSILGQLMDKISVHSSNTLQLQTAAWPEGTYMLEVITDKGIITKTFIRLN